MALVERRSHREWVTSGRTPARGIELEEPFAYPAGDSRSGTIAVLQNV
ncbi:MAG: hypothetical protein AVDCRST_MAG75-2891 [uncultured Propionibacteriaceae bacterium]|uniref:Uncharacterized protein n=1 Tax=uncultured Propionibacteriaceae bacterium TaxID=257457 RepID=A0A6J4PHR9_9ACTN|nr:MAG: hypothetical protein AVDCRST_MAG75-2891 [uncultured Propionibacteriaceae bacterium]